MACAHAAGFRGSGDFDIGREDGASFSELAQAREHEIASSADHRTSFAERSRSDEEAGERWVASNGHRFEAMNAALPGITPAIDEPSTYALLAAGLVGMGLVARRKRTPRS
jgi:hypothetical protein